VSTVVEGIVATTVPLLAAGLVAPSRLRLPLLALILAVGFGVAGAFGVVFIEDLWILPAGLGMTHELVLLGLWCLVGALARSLGPIGLPGPVGFTPLLMGAVMGEVPAAAMLASAARTPSGAARLALTAAAGGMIGRIGDPAMLVLLADFPGAVASVMPLALVMAWLVRPRPEHVHAWNGALNRRHGVMLLLVLLGVWPRMTIGVLAVTAALFIVWSRTQQRPLELMTPAWQLGATSLAALAVAGGAAEQAAVGLELSFELLGTWASPVLVGVSAVLAATTDGVAMAVFAQAVVDRALSLDPRSIAVPMAVGVAVGGLGPLIAAGALRAGWWLWGLQVMAAVAWGWAWAVA